jgi:nucleotide-binding universal stress UspA family protein
MSQRGMKWIVGLDLRRSSQGAIKFAAWLGRTSTAQGGEHIVGIHVLEEAYLRAALRYHHLAELIAGASEAAQEVVARAGAEDRIAEIHVVQGGTAERSLEAARIYHHADAMIIGRYAKREGHSLLRLGRVARRIVRRLAMPVIVVPPDHDPSTASDGPIVASVDLGDEADEAVSFAAQLAQRLQRPLLLAHVASGPEDYGAHYIPQASLDRMTREHQRDGEDALEQWATTHGYGDAERVVVQGGVVDQLVDLAVQRNACMLVAGSRLLSTLERVLLTSVGSELAATAPCPVAIAPPATQR